MDALLQEATARAQPAWQMTMGRSHGALRKARATTHQLREVMIFWRPGNLNLARRKASVACDDATGRWKMVSSGTWRSSETKFCEASAADTERRLSLVRHCSTQQL